MMPHIPNPQAYAIALAMILILSAACAEPGRIELGMSQNEVVRLLGEPDRKTILDGKVLRETDELRATDIGRYRFVYMYDKSGLKIWFEAGKVSGVTQHGLSIL